MNFDEIFIIVCILVFYYLSRKFIDLGGMNFNLLKKIMELIILLFLMILFKYKEEIKRAIKYDKCQRKLEEFLKRNGK